MVIFCTKRADRQLVFRAPTPRDTLNSPSREQFLPPRHEILPSELQWAEGQEDLGLLRRNDTQKLAKWHMASALGHWDVMRSVLPAKVWENW
jgi:hypothetical protein